MLSRAHGGFMAKLFAQEVPEVYDGVIEIRAVARDPGSRAKMAVVSNDSSIDPVGACVGMRGSRVQAVVAELQGEKIDIIQWSPDEATFLVNALAPAEVTKVVMDEEDERVEVVVPDEQLSLAIGRRGQNVRLASQLTGWQIDIMTESQESERRQREFAERTQLFQEALDVDEVIAQLLVTEGFATVEDVAYVDASEIAAIEGFDEDTAEEIQARARDFLDKEAAEYDAKRRELGRRGRRAGDRGRHPADGRGAGRGRGEDRRGPGRPGARRPARLVRDQGRRAGARAGRPGSLRPGARGRRGPDHARPRGHGLDRAGAGTGARRGRRRSRRLDPPRKRRRRRLRRTRAPATPGGWPDRHGRDPGAGRRERRDIVSGEVMDEARLIRFVAGPDGPVAPDLARKLPGRGLWVAADRASVETAAKKGLFARAAKAKLSAPADLADQVEALLKRRLLSGLGLARKAGELTSGFEKVLAAIAAGKAAWLIEASDGAADGRRKLLAAPRTTARRPCSASLRDGNWVWPWAWRM